ncbi:potassium voltage-gated channel subfamily KQT member 2-like [Oppia nitens]|uniref:potassium voltage-gated channel subfamily KQT member 2-like n=1 Tax=Oppia nitens TaxID=1686743 RepID=UPI0023DACA6E|nr:potassium voltage-gated channel subfamily KQT member 2-like [Oppia nitens]
MSTSAPKPESKDIPFSANDWSEIERQDSVRVIQLGSRPTISVNDMRVHTKCFNIKIRIFCALHRPLGYAKLYHYVIVIAILFSIIVLNLMAPEVEKKNIFINKGPTYVKVIIDFIIAVILITEQFVRLWSCDCIIKYKGLKGKLYYVKDYRFSRLIDVSGIVIFLVYSYNKLFIQSLGLDSVLRLIHLTQLLQLHRILYRVLKLMIETIISQSQQIYIVMIFGWITLTFTAFCIYLIERGVNRKIDTISDSFWLTFVTFATIGYGDLSPITVMGKLVILLLGSLGVVFFALPSNIFGTGLALKIEENNNRSTVLSIPAVKLLQSIIRFHTCNKRYDTDINWTQYMKSNGQPLTPQDRACIRFLRLLMYLKDKNSFKRIIGLQDDVLKEQNTKEVSNRLIHLEKSINVLNYQINQQKQIVTNIDKLLIKITTKINSDQKTDK